MLAIQSTCIYKNYTVNYCPCPSILGNVNRKWKKVVHHFTIAECTCCFAKGNRNNHLFHGQLQQSSSACSWSHNYWLYNEKEDNMGFILPQNRCIDRVPQGCLFRFLRKNLLLHIIILHSQVSFQRLPSIETGPLPVVRSQQHCHVHQRKKRVREHVT